jgi:aminopeptidase N
MTKTIAALGAGLWLLIPGLTLAESDSAKCAHWTLRQGAETSPSGRQYAPSREIDILHLALDVTPDFKQRGVSSRATLRFKPIAKPLTELRLDGVDLRVETVTATEKILGWQATDREVIVTFAEPLPPDTEVSVTTSYRAFPKKGLYFRTPEMGYRAEDMQLWTQGESIEARHWFPCFDAPNEKFTSEITCRVAEGITVLSNGRLVSSEKDASGLVAVRWLQDKPHVTYLISLVAGYFKKVEDRYRDIPMAFWVPASQIAYAAESFKDTKDIMGFFEKEIGVAYPWAKYDQVCVEDFVAGGMENTSITTLTDGTLHTPDFEQLRSSQGLVAHELAHQWFGDLVTCKDWANLWLNEGFATYYEHLYDGYKHGTETLQYRLYESAKHILAQPNQTNAIVRRDYRDPGEQFGYLAYPKGAWVLHMLRSQLGEALYRRCIKTYLERHQYGNVETEDLVRVIEELSGRSWDQFFDQYVYHAAQPELAVAYGWDERAKLVKITVTQNQRLSDDVLLFNVPLTLRFKTKSGAVDRQITVEQKSEDFYFPLPEAPTVVRVDPELSLLAKIVFNPPAPMRLAQLEDQSDMVGRLIAVEQLGERKERSAIGKLKDALNNDPFHGVRLAAAQALRSIGGDEAFDALLASMKQKDARVRHTVVDAVAGFYRDASRDQLLALVRQEKNPDIVARSIRALGGYHQPEIREMLLGYLRTGSFRNILGDAAIEAMRAHDDAFYVNPIRDALEGRADEFTSGGLARALETLGFLARNEPNRDAVREFLLRFLNSEKQPVRLGAIRALGAVGDPAAIAPLEAMAAGPQDRAETRAAERAVADLRAERKPSAELRSLRESVSELQRDNRDLRREMDDLRKKLEALSGKPAAEKPRSAKPVVKPPRGI